MSVAPESGRNRIMIYGPKTDGTYVVEFRTAEGEVLAISVPADPRAQALPGADAIWVVRAGRSVRNIWRPACCLGGAFHLFR
jgi:hypothetical protein